MTIDLNKGWFFCKEDGIPVETDLPHDAMLAETRDRICRNGCLLYTSDAADEL